MGDWQFSGLEVSTMTDVRGRSFVWERARPGVSVEGKPMDIFFMLC